MNNYPENNQNETVYENFENPPGATPETASAKKKKPYVKIIAIVAAVAVILGVCAFAFAGKIGHTIAKISGPEKHFDYVVKTSINDLSSPLFSAMDEFNSMKPDGVKPVAAEGSVKAEISGSLQEFVNGKLGANISNAEISYVGVTCPDEIAMDLKFLVGEKELAAIEGRIDYDKKLVSLLIPALGDTALAFPIETDETMPEEVDTFIEKIRNAEVDLPDSKGVKKLLAKYIDIVLGELKEIERTDEKLTVSDVTQKMTRFDVVLTEQLMLDIEKAVLTEAENDEDIKALIEEFYNTLDTEMREMIFDGQTASEVFDEFSKSVSRALENIEKEEADSDEEIKFVVWADKNGGISAVKFDNEENDAKIFFGIAKDGKDTGYEISMTDENGDETFEISGVSSEKDKKISGNADMAIQGKEALDVTYQNVSFEKNAVSGEFTVIPGEIPVAAVKDGTNFDISKYALTFKVDAKETEGETVLTLTENGSEIAKLTVKTVVCEEIPSMSEHTKTETDPDKWISSVDQSKLLTLVVNISDALGISLLG